MNPNEERVSMVPAALDSVANGSYVAVKYGPPKKPVYTAERQYSVFTLYLKDRTIYYGRGNSLSLGVVVGDEPDVFMPFAPLTQPVFLEDIGYKYLMVGPERQRNSTFIRRNKHVKVFSDSGGFQLASGQTDFIDPDQLADFYRARVNYGIGLDVPLPLPLHYTGWLDRMALVTAKNNKHIVRALKGSKAEVYDVSHGLTPEGRKSFLKVTMKHQSSENLSLGGIGQANYDTAAMTMVTSVLNMCYVFDRAKQDYKRFHVLGTTAYFFQVLYFILTKTNAVRLITADSSSHAQGVLAFAIRMPPFSEESMGPQSYTIPSSKQSYMLPCSCPVCSLVGHPLAYRMVPQLAFIHNLCVMRSFTSILEDKVDQFLSGQITAATLAKGLVKSADFTPTVALLIQFCAEVHKGYDKTYAKYRSKLDILVRGKRTSLFDNSTKIPAGKEKVVKSVTAAIERYEKFHKIR